MAYRRKEGAKEELGVRVAFDVQQRDPGHALLRNLVGNGDDGDGDDNNDDEIEIT